MSSTFFQHITKSKNFKQSILIGFILLSVLLWLSMWLYGKFYVSTDNAYVNANVVQIAARVSGQISHFYVNNNQYVQKGQVLFEIDSQPYLVALHKAQAQLAINQAELANAQAAATRKMALVKKKFISTQEGDNALTLMETAESTLKLASAAFEQASLDYGWTRVVAPTSGWITNLSLRVGDNVVVNQPLFVLISDKEFWVDANFKETNIANIKPGQYASVSVDMYPGYKFDGMVQSISGSTGNVFSLLPPQNATGNWVKITQRIPVRVLITNPNPNYPLRVGSSAEVTISLKKFV